MTDENQKSRGRKRLLQILRTLIFVAFWGGIVLFCWLNRDKISVEAIVNFVPQNIVVAIIILWVLYALKGCLFTVYGGLLYAAGGIMFPLPLAIFVNTVGTVLMISVPYFIGKSAGAKHMERIVEKNKKMADLNAFTSNNEFLTCLIIRLIGFLPGDLVAMFFGAQGMKYRTFLLSSLLGLFPSVVAFSVIGMSVSDPSSPAFWGATLFEITLSVVSLAVYVVLKKKKTQKDGAK